MPVSTDLFKEAIFQHIKFVAWGQKILDVGIGKGTYSDGLSPLKIDGIEIHKPYIEEFNLVEKYNNIYNVNILNFDYDGYDYIILGDVLEHIHKDDAIRLIQDISNKKIKCLVGVPYLLGQTSEFDFLGKHWNVDSEIHLQPDLTHRVMKSRYPSLDLFLTDNSSYGYYLNYINYKF